MGGIGSGRRWHFDARKTTSNFRSIDVRRWHRDGLLNPGNQFGWNWSLDGEVTASIHVRVEHGVVRLLYKTRGHDENWREMDYPVTLDSTECNFGGSRKWFICPAWGCRRRVAVLHGGAVFACRTCHQIAYPSQNENAPDRALRRAERIREKLGWPAGVLNLPGGKPKGMHWRTYHRLVSEQDRYTNASMAHLMNGLEWPICSQNQQERGSHKRGL